MTTGLSCVAAGAAVAYKLANLSSELVTFSQKTSYVEQAQILHHFSQVKSF